MLPTNELSKKGQLCDTAYGINISGIDGVGMGQHLYIYSDEKIKDNRINGVEYKGWQIRIDATSYPDHLKHKTVVEHTNQFIGFTANCYPIIASTDTSLDNRKPYESVNKPVSQPSPEFVTYYIEQYNKGNKIEEVLVEYDGYIVVEGYQNSIKLKVDSNNCISIKSIKESWSRDEVIALAKSAWKAGVTYESLGRRGFNKESKEHYVDKWIAENL